ncbi:hypothetical protein I7I48_00279 [Histoplasma ohiense]|nr:hypothetical protein I7I48_00279 [Histoplasma ohiense (nom. inval.)]
MHYSWSGWFPTFNPRPPSLFPKKKKKFISPHGFLSKFRVAQEGKSWLLAVDSRKAESKSQMLLALLFTTCPGYRNTPRRYSETDPYWVFTTPYII